MSQDEAFEVVFGPRGVFRGGDRRTLEPLVGPGRGVVVFFGGLGWKKAGEKKNQKFDSEFISRLLSLSARR
jgi:hypothetical protein